MIYPHPSDARESQKDTPFPFFLFRRQRVSKGNFIFNRENIVRIRSTFLAERNAPRPLLPFGRISPAAKPGWPVTGPAFWVCRAKSGAAFRCAKPPCAVVRFAAMASPPRTAILPFPSRLRRAGSPTAKPRPSSFSTRFLLRKHRRSRSLPPLGATCSLPHFRFAQMWPRIFPRGLPGYVPLFHGWPRARTPAQPVLFIGQKMRYSVLAGFSSISQCR